MEQVFLLVAISTSMFKLLMKPFQQVYNLKYIIAITPTQTLTFIGLQYNEPNPNVDLMVQ